MEKHSFSKKKGSKRIILAISVAILAVFFVFLLSSNIIKYGSVATKVIFDKKISLKKSNNRINILLLGIGGGRHQGPNLSDTIIFASIDKEKKKVTLVSIPRDFWVPELAAKINTAYAFGQKQGKGGGLALAKTTIEKIIGQPIDYGIRLDFAGFVKAVDIVGGIDVEVEQILDDLEYPIPGKEDYPCDQPEEDLDKLATAESQLEAFPCRYEHVHFDAGPNHMDGETALKFVRSRHAEGQEGTDFARSKRQEKIIQAFKEKVFSIGTFLNPIKVVSLLDVFEGSIDTDISDEEIDDFIKLAQKMSRGAGSGSAREDAQITSVTLDVGDDKQNREGLLINPIITEEFRNQWALIPRIGNGNYREIQKYIDCEIKIGNCDPFSEGDSLQKESP